MQRPPESAHRSSAGQDAPAQARPEVNLPDRECDIVMKGGITSGVVYPSAIRELGERYRFRSIGGTSVGAIAAALTAAAEYGRQTGRGTGFAQLEVINDEMAGEDFLLSLFKPGPGARGLYAIYLAVIGERGPARVLGAVVGQVPWVLLLLLAWWGTIGWTAWRLGGSWWLAPTLVAAWGLVLGAIGGAVVGRISPRWLGMGVISALLWPVLMALPSIGVRGWRYLSDNGFGLVPGASAEGDALCDWLHRHVQAAAGLDEDRPLTFGMLARDRGRDGEPVGIDLQMVTTNLSTARPVRLPGELREYAFDPADLEGTLPASVLGWLTRRGRAEAELVRLPSRDDLPVLLAFRMSLSFPVLFTAMRLLAPTPETGSGAPVPHWFSDGGIGSNFPVHFFDAWMPRRPTFALSFTSFPLDRQGRVVIGESDIGLPPGPNEPRLPRWVSVTGLGGFLRRILDTMQNWRDTLQAELPGFRDRVYETRLDREAGEGGLNLGMDPDTIRRLQDRGSRVGGAIADTFDMDQHFFTRYLVAMQQLQLGLAGGELPLTGVRSPGLRPAFDDRRQGFSEGDVGAGELFGHDRSWLPPAGAATGELIGLAESWASFGAFVDEGEQPRPRPVMRINPDV